MSTFNETELFFSASSPDENPVTHHICFETNDNGFGYMGYSIRTQDWRYTEWRKWDGAKLAGVWDASGATNASFDAIWY